MVEPPLIEIAGLVKQYQGLRPLRLASLHLARGERYAIAGLDAGAAEAFVLLVTGASVPDEGEVRVAGRSTREIATDTEWLLSLDRFGIVTARAVLIGALPIAANLALPMTLSIEPIPGEIQQRVEQLAAEVGLPIARLTAAASTLSAEERVRVHLARALSSDPLVLLLEHPTAGIEAAAAEALGETLKQVSDARGVSWIALTEDDRFARATGGTRVRLRPATGELVRDGFWRRVF
jgi:predicted ABC-type transport system involved in lysophospholipase L1 biosynthesis ATPase subunit